MRSAVVAHLPPRSSRSRTNASTKSPARRVKGPCLAHRSGQPALGGRPLEQRRPYGALPVELQMIEPVCRLDQRRAAADRCNAQVHAVGRLRRNVTACPQNSSAVSGRPFSAPQRGQRWPPARTSPTNRKPRRSTVRINSCCSPVSPIARRAAGCDSVGVGAALQNHAAVPNGLQQLVLAHDPIAVLDQMRQNVEHLRFDMDCRFATARISPLAIELAVTKHVDHRCALDARYLCLPDEAGCSARLPQKSRIFFGNPPAAPQDGAALIASVWQQAQQDQLSAHVPQARRQGMPCPNRKLADCLTGLPERSPRLLRLRSPRA